MKKDITRAIIDATVDRGLREIYEDPRRSIRKLADLGRQFNKGRFMQDIYALFQDLLRNDDSPYYTAIEHLLQNTDRKRLKDFGINMGYNSLTKGAKLIRAADTKKGLHIPWAVIFRLDPTVKGCMTPNELISVIAQGRKLGIYTYLIRLERSLAFFEDLLKVFLTYDDCSFLFVLPDMEIDSSLSSYIQPCNNVLYFLPAFDDSCGANVRLLKRHKAWYGLYMEYDEAGADSIVSIENAWEYLTQDSAFLLTIARDGTSLSTIEKTVLHIKKMRLAPVVPLFIFDLYGDAMSIQKLVSSLEYFFEIRADGSFHTNFGDTPASEGLPDLEKAFAEHLA